MAQSQMYRAVSNFLQKIAFSKIWLEILQLEFAVIHVIFLRCSASIFYTCFSQNKLHSLANNGLIIRNKKASIPYINVHEKFVIKNIQIDLSFRTCY